MNGNRDTKLKLIIAGISTEFIHIYEECWVRLGTENNKKNENRDAYSTWHTRFFSLRIIYSITTSELSSGWQGPEIFGSWYGAYLRLVIKNVSLFSDPLAPLSCVTREFFHSYIMVNFSPSAHSFTHSLTHSLIYSATVRSLCASRQHEKPVASECITAANEKFHIGLYLFVSM